jgi:hypothetical protein
MSAKIALTLIGLVMFAQGIGFYFFSESITVAMFPVSSAEAIEVGAILRQLLAAGSMFIGIILFLARTNVTSAAKRILFGASIGFSLIVVMLIHIAISYDFVNIPIFPLVLFGLFAIIAFLYGDPGIKDRRGY